MDEPAILYERDGSVLLTLGDAVLRVPAGWTPATLDAAAAAFFAAA
ncbi:hypothetical protein [Sphingomonas sp.]